MKFFNFLKKKTEPLSEEQLVRVWKEYMAGLGSRGVRLSPEMSDKHRLFEAICELYAGLPNGLDPGEAEVIERMLESVYG